MKKLLYVFLLFALCVVGCSRKVDSRLVLADSLVENRPDSAYVILRSVNPDSLSGGENRALYSLLHFRHRQRGRGAGGAGDRRFDAGPGRHPGGQGLWKVNLPGGSGLQWRHGLFQRHPVLYAQRKGAPPMENSALSGRVHSFQSMGAVDGPGLRYVVFFQGCPLRCAYCHNPDTWDFDGGQQVTVQDVLQKVRRCAPYIKKTGGVTLTGGEPLAQSDFAAALLAALKAEGFHTALDTSGAASLESAAKVLEHTDLVLADLKFTTEEDYRLHTGGSLAHTLKFLDLCRELGRPVWLRHVVVPGLNDGPEAAARLAELAKGYDNVEKVELLPFRTLCIEKYAALGIPFPLEGTPPAGEEHLAPFYEALGALAVPAK